MEIILVILYIIISVVMAIEFAKIADEKGYSDRVVVYFVICLIFSVPGWILVWALPDRNVRLVTLISKKELEEMEKEKEVKKQLICKNCGYELDEDDEECPECCQKVDKKINKNEPKRFIFI